MTALVPLVLVDLMRGTGRNASQGVVATTHGVGAVPSSMVAGLIVVSAGYSVAFLARRRRDRGVDLRKIA